MRFQAGGEVFRQVQLAARHPARRLHGLGRNVVVRILFVVPPRVVTEDGVDAQQAEKEDEPPAQLVRPTSSMR